MSWAYALRVRCYRGLERVLAVENRESFSVYQLAGSQQLRGQVVRARFGVVEEDLVAMLFCGIAGCAHEVAVDLHSQLWWEGAQLPAWERELILYVRH